MPVAAVHEDGDPLATEDDIGTDVLYGPVEPIAAQPMLGQGTPQYAFRSRIAPSVRLHHRSRGERGGRGVASVGRDKLERGHDVATARRQRDAPSGSASAGQPLVS